MGLASLILGEQNPFAQFVADNRHQIKGAFAGFGTGTGLENGLARSVKGAAEGGVMDDARRVLDEEKAQQQQALNQTTEWLKNNGKDALYAAVQSGAMDPGQAWQMALEEDAAAKQGQSLTADMQNYQFAQVNPGFADFLGGGNVPKPTSAIQEYEYAKGQGFGGTFQDFQQSARPAPAMNATIQKEIFETDEGLQAGEAVVSGLTRALELNNQAYDGPFADQRSYVSSLAGDQGGLATQELKNVVTSQALESLKAVFGGMPTEGERKILLEIQGSVDQPKAVREAIYKRALSAAERRIAANTQKAGALRGGEYFQPGYSAATRPAANTTSTGLSWSIEP